MSLNLKVFKKSEKLLVQTMGQEDYDKFVEEGKIEVVHDGVVYELDQEARVYNRTAGQHYCIQPICPDNLPILDQLAVKYAYLRNNIKKVEEVANKRDVGRNVSSTYTSYSTAPVILREPPIARNYDEFVRNLGVVNDDIRTQLPVLGENPTLMPYNELVGSLELQGWYREQLTIDEINERVVFLRDVPSNAPSTETEAAIEIGCPNRYMMSIMGIRQVPVGVDAGIAHSFRVRFADMYDNELPLRTIIRITKEKSDESVIQLARIFYADINITCNMENGHLAHKTDGQWYRFRDGILLQGNDRLKMYVVRPDIDVFSRNSRFAIDMDMWSYGG